MHSNERMLHHKRLSIWLKGTICSPCGIPAVRPALMAVGLLGVEADGGVVTYSSKFKTVVSNLDIPALALF
jgi:hypothetical protein